MFAVAAYIANDGIASPKMLIVSALFVGSGR